MVSICDSFVTVKATGKAIGAPSGVRLSERAFSRVKEASFHESGLVLAIDLREVSLATTSYIKAGLLSLFLAGQRFADRMGTGLADSFDLQSANVYPVFANLAPEVLDSVNEVFAGRRLPFVTATLDADGLHSGRIHGFLDEALVRTIRLIGGRDEVTALDLADEFSGEGIKPTAWNNRLNDLWRNRLLRRAKRGKAWWYKPVIKELRYG